MQFKYTYINDNLEQNQIKFLRNLNTEKMFRDETGQELQAQITTLYMIMQDFEKDPDDKAKASARFDLNFDETRHEILRFMYAEQKGDNLVQSEKTRLAYDKLTENEQINEGDALLAFLKSL